MKRLGLIIALMWGTYSYDTYVGGLGIDVFFVFLVVMTIYWLVTYVLKRS